MSATAYLYRNSELVITPVGNNADVNGDALCVGCVRASNGSNPFSGDVAEIIIFRDGLNTAQRILIENYLSAKYGIALADNDIYDGDDAGNGDYDLDVAGIGRESDGANTEAHSKGMTLVNVSFLQDDGDYMVIGHKVASNAVVNTECPAGVAERWTREWYLDKTDVNSNDGLVDVVFDFSEAGIAQPAYTSFTLLKRSTAGSGDFSAVATTSTLNGDQVVFEDVDASLLGSGFTLGHGTPTAVELVRFEATAQAAGVLVTWETGSELDNVGFNLYRAETAEGPYTQLNFTLIPPQAPGSVMGAVYTWLDEGVDSLVPYYYKLEDVDVKGLVTVHGPVASEVVMTPSAVGLAGLHGAGSGTLLALVALGAVVVWLRRR